MLKKLKERQCIRGVEVPVVREEVYILTPAGVTFSAEFSDKPLNYHTQPSRINIGRLRHDLNVQIAILNRIKNQNPNKKVSFLAERELDSGESTGKYRINNFSVYGDQKNRKIPDAIIIEETVIDSNIDSIEDRTKKIKKVKKTALEIELTPKADIHIYHSFVQHLQAMQNDCLYDHVTYIFRTETMKNYYERRFLKDMWPRYHKDDERKKWHRSEKPFFVNDPSIRSHFSFVVEELFNG